MNTLNDIGWMMEAYKVANLSTCASKHRVGCVIVPRHPAVPAVSGFNGALSSLPPCDSSPFNLGVRCTLDSNGRCTRAIHAEQRAMANAAGRGVNLQDATVYTTLVPCFMCSQLIILSGVARLCYTGSPSSTNGLELLLQFIEVTRLDLSPSLQENI